MSDASDRPQDHVTPAGTAAQAAGRDALAVGRRVAVAAMALALLLVTVKGVFGYLRKSPALMADAVNSGEAHSLTTRLANVERMVSRENVNATRIVSSSLRISLGS